MASYVVDASVVIQCFIRAKRTKGGLVFMRTVSLQLPDTVFAALGFDPDEFVQEMRIAAAVKWYELGEISQGKAAQIAGLTRSEFINALSRFKVSPLQYTAQELAEELASAD